MLRRLLTAGLLMIVTSLGAHAAPAEKSAAPADAQTITLGGGCFWCLEAVFEEMRGVVSVTSGYAGGDVANPDYEQVSSGTTGHAEVVQIVYDPKVLPLDVLLRAYFTIHDPTTLNRQGNDVGTQYRSIAFYRDAAQHAAIEKAIAETATSG
ncbi:MAG TPA: peptide-methionine (S)-S-oxide reductase MsrA, partial [Rudaea sp.]|nr:peptide-methionine (S)-S-oxide reductase MsrA [Rudaea sp.]